MSSENGTKSKVETKLIKNDKLHVLTEASWGRSLPLEGERPKCYSRLDMIPGDVSSRKCWKGVRRPAVKTRKICGP